MFTGARLGRILGIIQARLASTRLPAKLLAPLGPGPLLEVLVQRVRPARVDEWWLATTDLPSDTVTAEWGRVLGLNVYRGDTEDALSRFTAIIRLREPEWVVRVTGDDPFMDAATIDFMLDQLPSLDPRVAVVAGDASAPKFPLGYIPEIARAADILESESTIPENEPHHRAHVLSWLYKPGRTAVFEGPASWPSRGSWRWTVDTLDDLHMTQAAFGALGSEWRTSSYLDWVALLDRHPEIPAMNIHVRQKQPDEP